jgi:Zn-dependent protease
MGMRLTIDHRREALLFRLPDGLPVYTHYSFGLIALLVTAPLWMQWRLSSMIIAAALIPIMYHSVLAHELGHKAAAARQQARTTEIEIYIYGGAAHLEWDHDRAIAMRLIALAGPAVSLGLAALFFALHWLMVRNGASDAPRYFEPLETVPIISRTLYLGFLLNLWFAVFNLLPAYPLDGGIVAEETLARWIGLRRARLIVGLCGSVIVVAAIVAAFAMAMAGMPVLVFASLRANTDAVRENWRAPAKVAPVSQPPRVTSVVQFKKRGGNS